MRTILLCFLLFFTIVSCTKDTSNRLDSFKVSIKDCNGHFKGQTLQWNKASLTSGATSEGTDPHHTLDVTYLGNDKVRIQINSTAPISVKSLDLVLKTKSETTLGDGFNGLYTFEAGNQRAFEDLVPGFFATVIFSITKASGINKSTLNLSFGKITGSTAQQAEIFTAAGEK